MAAWMRHLGLTAYMQGEGGPYGHSAPGCLLTFAGCGVLVAFLLPVLLCKQICSAVADDCRPTAGLVTPLLVVTAHVPTQCHA